MSNALFVVPRHPWSIILLEYQILKNGILRYAMGSVLPWALFVCLFVCFFFPLFSDDIWFTLFFKNLAKNRNHYGSWIMHLGGARLVLFFFLVFVILCLSFSFCSTEIIITRFFCSRLLMWLMKLALVYTSILLFLWIIRYQTFVHLLGFFFSIEADDSWYYLSMNCYSRNIWWFWDLKVHPSLNPTFPYFYRCSSMELLECMT